MPIFRKMGLRRLTGETVREYVVGLDMPAPVADQQRVVRAIGRIRVGLGQAHAAKVAASP
jgi:hypothetical protein